MRNILKKWFNWHVWPEKDAIQSVYEIALLFLILGVCWYAYVEMNTVRTVKYEIDAACLKKPDFYTPQMSGYNDTLYPKTVAEITVKSPMTKNEDMLQKFASDSTNIIVKIEQWLECEKVEGRYEGDLGFWIDNRRKIIEEYDSLAETSWMSKEIGLLYYKRTVHRDVNNYPSLLTHNPFEELYGYQNGVSGTQLYKNCDQKEIYDIRWNEISDSCITQKNYVSGKCAGLQSRGGMGSPKRRVWFLPPGWMYLSTMISKPSWFSFEDISQQYYDIKLRTYDIDSTTLSIEFCGVAEFSQMIPQPDEVGMSSVVFTDYDKIEQIESDGLKFHARFKELENMQQIRLFLLTSIMAGIIIIIIVFIIMSLYKIHRQFNVSRCVWTLLAKISLGFVLYVFIYWFFMLKVLNNGTIFICNLISIPLTLIVMWMLSLFVQWRDVFVKYSKAFITVSACLTFLSLMGYAMYKYYSADIKALLDKGYYSRATQMMYDKIMDADTISKSDFNLLRAILSENPLADSIVLHNVDDFTIEDGNILIKQKDTISLYDISTKKIRKIMHPNSDKKIEIKGQYIYINDDDYCDVARVSNPDRFIRFKGRFLETTDSGGSVVTSIVNVDKSDCTIMYYTYPRTKAYKKTFMKNIEGYPKAYLHNTLICEQNDTTIFYKIEGSHKKKLLTHKGTSVKVLDAKEKIVMTSNYGWKYFHYIDNKGISNTDTLYIPSISIKYVKGNVWNKVFIKQLREILREFPTDAWRIYSVSISDSRMYIGSGNWKNNRYNVKVYNIGNKIAKVKSINYDKDVICSDDGYIAYHSDNKLFLESIDDTSKMKQIGESCDYHRYGGYYIINDYLYHYADNSLRVLNLESDSILIARNKYLSNGEKKKLAEKINKILKKKQ